MIETKLKLILALTVLLATVMMPAFGQQTAAEWLEKGNAFAMQSKYDEALKAYDQAISINPQYADAWYNKGIALGNLGKYDEALQAFDQTIRINPQYADAWYKKGAALKALGRTSESDAAFAKAKELENAA